MGNRKEILNKLRMEFGRLRQSYGVGYALNNLLWWANFYFPTPWRFRLSKGALMRKTRFLSGLIERDYADIIGKYLKSPGKIQSSGKRNIWVFWGQGEEKMPELVRACYRQLKHNHENVVLVTNENVLQYLDLAPELLKRARDGRLSWAHLSDIIRTKLLYRHGGLWLDATVWATDGIPFDKLAEMPFFSANGKVVNTPRSVCFWTSLGHNWSTWCMWGEAPGYPLYGFVSETMERMALSDKAWPDYVFQDFLIYYALHYSPSISNDMEQSGTLPCRHRNSLARLMNTPFDSGIYQSMCETDFVFKLSYRTPWRTSTPDGRHTFYGTLIAEE